MEEVATEKKRIPIKGVLAVISGFLINLILGALFSFGNIMPYIASYMREIAGLDVTYRLLPSLLFHDHKRKDNDYVCF